MYQAIRPAPRHRQRSDTIPAPRKLDAATTLPDESDALVTLEHWPGGIKVPGPISAQQQMAAAFDPAAERLRSACNAYRAAIVADGSDRERVKRHVPAAFDDLPGFHHRRPAH